MECTGCGHLRSRHMLDVDGVVRCWESASGVSTSGVLGLPWSTTCDCADFYSASTERRRARETAEQEKRERVLDALVAAMREQMADEDRATEGTRP